MCVTAFFHVLLTFYFVCDCVNQSHSFRCSCFSKDSDNLSLGSRGSGYEVEEAAEELLNITMEEQEGKPQVRALHQYYNKVQNKKCDVCQNLHLLTL